MSREAETDSLNRAMYDGEDSVTGGDVIALGARLVRVCGNPGQVLTNHRGCVAIRNLETGRLSYKPERELRQAKRAAEALPPYEHACARMWTLVADDAYACTFQSLAQYRAALLEAFANALGMVTDY